MNGRWLGVLIALAACRGNPDDRREPAPPTPTPTPTPTPAPPVVDAAADPACADKTAQLGTWLEGLVADGHRVVFTAGVGLVKLAVPPSPVPEAPVVSVGADIVSFQGKLVGNSRTMRRGDLAHDLAELMGRIPSARPDVIVIADARAPWGAI